MSRESLIKIAVYYVLGARTPLIRNNVTRFGGFLGTELDRFRVFYALTSNEFAMFLGYVVAIA